MGKYQRDKGKAGERWLASQLREAGFNATTGRQHRGGPDSPDVITKGIPYHWEMKSGYERLSLKTLLSKCEEETDDTQAPVVVWKPTRQRPLVALYWDDFAELLMRAYESEKL